MYGKNTHIQSKSSSFQDHHPWQQAQKWQMIKISSFQDPHFKTFDKHNGNHGKLSSFKDPLSRPLLQGITQRVRNLNLKYYLPTHEHTKVITDPGRVLRDQPQVESTVAPQSALIFNPIYVEPGSTQFPVPRICKPCIPIVLIELVTCMVSMTSKLIHKYHLYNIEDTKYWLNTRPRSRKN